MKLTDLEISNIVSAVRTYFQEAPLGIYLYGSYTKGLATERSDVDICVLMDGTKKKYLRKYYHLDKWASALSAKDVHVVVSTKMNGFCKQKID